MEKIRFDKFIKLNRGFDLPDSQIEEGSYPVVASTSIKAYHNEYKVEGPMVTTGRSGSLGKVVYVDGKCWPLNTTLYVKDFKGNVPRYVYYYLQMMHLEQFNAGAGVPTLNQNHLHSIKILVHEKDTQQKIASILSTYDSLIENNTKRIRLLEQMAENLYKEWFVRFRFPGHENVDMENGLPKGWKIERLGSFLKFERGVGYGSKDIENGDYTLLSMNNIKPFGGFISDYSRPFSGKFKEFQLLKEHDLIMSITDMTQDRRIIGYVGIVPPGPANRVICTHLIKISSSLYGNFFLNGLFNYSGLSRVIAERATGTNVLGMTADILKKVKCFLPEHSLIERYESVAKSLFTEKFKLEEQNTLLIRQRDLLLPRLMSGKLEVKL